MFAYHAVAEVPSRSAHEERNGALCEDYGYDEGANTVKGPSGPPPAFGGNQGAPLLCCIYWYDGRESAAPIPAEIH